MKRLLIAAAILAAGVAWGGAGDTNAVFLYSEITTNMTENPKPTTCPSCSAPDRWQERDPQRTVVKDVIKWKWYRIQNDDGVVTQAIWKVIDSKTNVYTRDWVKVQP